LSLPWFRFRRKSSEQHERASQHERHEHHESEHHDGEHHSTAQRGARSEPELTEPAAEADASAKPKRRRGSRGGRNRKKSTTTTAGAAPERKEPGPERTPRDDKQPERRELSQRQERRRDQASRRRREPARRAPLPAAKRELLVSVDVGERRVAVLEDGRVAEVYLERPERRSIAGNIYLGRVDNVLPGMEAAFVEIGLEKNGFLYVDEIVSPELEKGHGRKIQDLISRGQTILVQAVKDPMKTKGARLTTQISLPGRFVVLVPQGEGLGVSRRLDDEERARLKEILRRLDVRDGGVIVRTAAEGASEEDIERDLVFLQRLWRSIQARAKDANAPELIYQEAELPLRVVRDLFTGDFEKAYVDDERTYRRVVGYLKKTSPHMAERVVRYKEKTPLMEAFGVEQEIRSTLNRRVDLPSGGYLVFDYAEAFTVIDVNTGRFVGGRGKSSAGRLEDTITKNNLEAVKEVVRQLRLRDIGGIIVIDFIDMANPKNRAAVEEALRSELERDRTKTYVVEISPLGLVEMTRQNVTDGPREVMTRKCPTCGGDGIVYSEASAAIDAERRLRALAAGSRSQAFRVELADPVISALVGAGARRLLELEAVTKRRFFLAGKPGAPLDHFVVLAEGKLADLAPAAPVEEGRETMIQLVEVDRYDAAAAVGRLDGLEVVVAGAAPLVGKRLKARIERVLDGRAYAVPARKTKELPEPLTAEGEAEKPTRKPPARKAAAAGGEPAAAEGRPADGEPGESGAAEAEAASPEVTPAEPDQPEGESDPGRTSRRGSRGGRRRRKPAGALGVAEAATEHELEAAGETDEAPEPPRSVTIHVPGEDLGREGAVETIEPEPVEQAPEEPAVATSEDRREEGDAAAKPKRKTRRGSRGGRRRRKRAAVAEHGAADGIERGQDEPDDEPEAGEHQVAEAVATNGDWGYVPMSEWLDEIESR
jgi:ribonuclease G